MKNTSPWAARGLSRLLVMVMALLFGAPAATFAQAVDPVARGLAASAVPTSQLPRTQPSNIGKRLVEGRTANASFTLAGTYEMLIALSCPAGQVSAVKVVYQLGQNAGGTAAAPVVITSHVRSVPDTTDAASNAATTKAVYVGGSLTWALTPAASNARRNYITSDWVPIRSVARTDGGTYSLFVIRVAIPDGAIIVSGNGAQSFSNWATNPSGLIFRMRHITGATNYDLSVNWASFNSGTATASTGSPIAGLFYACDRLVYPIDGYGDSITEGQGTYIGEGFGVLAAQRLTQQNKQGIIYEWSNMGWSSQNYAQIVQNLKDAGDQGVLSSLITIPSFTPNSVGNNPITVNAIEANAGNWSGTPAVLGRAQISEYLKSKNVTPIWWTWLPTNTAVNNYGSSDSLRRADNDNVRAGAAGGMIIADTDAVLAGVTTNGQVQILAGATTDGIHPNDTGNLLLTNVIAKAIGRATGVSPVGYLVVSELASHYRYQDWLAANDNAPAEQARAA